ncbi:MAG: flagellar M-ring protein FliF [Alphaproteobacteria bacterium]|nr:flagellar M-ring protein FliF [Alphaproteobacteria bacterium]
MSEFMSGIRNIGAARLSAIGGVLVLFGAFFIFLFVRLSAPILVPLYADLPPSEVDKITVELSRMQLDYRLRNNGTTVLVPTENVPEIRLALAERGLPSKTDIGNEIFDREQGIGTSSFIQEINRKRAMEGELSRSIASLDTVHGARVHLVLPERKLFSRKAGKARASVVLRMRGAYRLDRSQIVAVQHLVSSSVPDLEPDKVSIIDERGVLLAMGGVSSYSGADRLEAMRINHEDRLKTSIEDLLQSTMGFGKVRAEVNIEMDLSQVQIEEKTFDPDGGALRSAEMIEEHNNAVNLEPNVVSTTINLPGQTDAENRVGSRENVSRTEERNNFEIPWTTSTRLINPGGVRRMSVAVLVDGRYVTDAEGNEIYEPRTATELEAIEELVKSTIGFEAERADQVKVVNMQFVEPVMDPEALGNKLFGFETSQISRLFEAGLLVVFGLLVIMLLVRPLLQKIFTAASHAVAVASGEGGDEYQRALESGEYDVEAFPGRIEMQAGGGMVNDSEGKLITAGGAISSGVDTLKTEDVLLDDIARIIDERPEDAVAVIRHWIYESPAN